MISAHRSFKPSPDLIRSFFCYAANPLFFTCIWFPRVSEPSPNRVRTQSEREEKVWVFICYLQIGVSSRVRTTRPMEGPCADRWVEDTSKGRSSPVLPAQGFAQDFFEPKSHATNVNARFGLMRLMRMLFCLISCQ